ncbi:hypothetical protein AAT19DRAFT_10076 [Rhodotorula toruloides]|uniref:MYND-type domain-containing protein n=1 Tax=Rhodotorula toruloides TaxID=5286 RepID=A0A2S9ZZL8_RHOTO|nr:hypothetical protein AAT19DRAFT_10076 [Rhodotorula toruloides]
MSTQAEHPCSVCDRKTKTTCGGCRTVYFCDRSCQAAIWSTHKWLCKNSPDIFTFPALTTDEAATLKQLVGGSDPVVKTAMKRIKLSERDGWQSGKYEVQRGLSQLSPHQTPIVPHTHFTGARRLSSTTSRATTAPYLNRAAHSASSSCTSSCATSKPALSRPPSPRRPGPTSPTRTGSVSTVSR